MKKHVYLKNVANLELNTEKCVGCKMCTIVCPHGVFLIEERQARIINKDWCMECGACMKNCPSSAIQVKTGVGCAAGIINGMLKGTAPNCDCGTTTNCC